MSIILPYGLMLRHYQQIAWDALVVNNYLRAITVWPRRNGKDLIALNIAVAKAQQRVGLVLYIAPFYHQIRSIIWEGMTKDGKRFLDYIPPELIEKRSESRMAIKFKNGSILRFGGSDNPDSLVGGNPVGIVKTEESLHRPEAWDYLRPILAENEGWALFNGTPRGYNHFYRLYHAAGKNPKWFVQYLTRDDTGIPTLEAIEEDRRSGMPESLIQQEYYCSWSASVEDVFIPLDVVSPLVELELRPEDYQHAKRVIGVDPAYAAKGDKATICKRQGRMVHPIRKFQGLENPALASEVAKDIEAFKPEEVYIDSGRGEGVIHRLWQMNPRYRDIVVPVHFGGKTYEELYGNKKAQMWGRARAHILSANPPVLPRDEDLIRDLTTPFLEMDEKHQIRIESKKHIKSRGFPSSDSADAYILTYAEEDGEAEGDYISDRLRNLGVTPEEVKQFGIGTRQGDFALNDYNVLDFL